MADITKAIQSLCPSAEFVITADDYSTIIWHKLEGDAPSLQEVKKEILRLQEAEVQDATDRAAAKAALLERLGITADEAALLLG